MKRNPSDEPNVMTSAEGFVVEIVDRTHIRFTQDGTCLVIEGETMSATGEAPTMAVYLCSPVLVGASQQRELLGIAARRCVGRKIEQAFASKQWVADVEYERTWLKKNSEIFEHLMNLKDGLRSRNAGATSVIFAGINAMTSTSSPEFLPECRVVIDRLLKAAVLTEQESAAMLEILKQIGISP